MLKLSQSALLFAVVACDRSPARPATIVLDSAGISIVESLSPGWGEEAPWAVDPEPMLTIGAASGDDPYQLYRVRGASRLIDGTIVVANEGSGELRFFDNTGVFLRNAGRHGDGPGEFSELSSMRLWVTPDRLLAVSDESNDRVNIFAEDGEYEDLIRLAPPPETPRAMLEGFFPDGSLLVKGIVGGGVLQGPPGTVIRSVYTFQRYAPSGKHLGDIAQVRGRPRYVHEHGGRTRFPYVPFTQNVIAINHGGGTLLLSDDGVALTHYDATGRLSGSIRWDAGEREAIADVWSRYVREVLDGMEDEQRRRWYRTYYDENLPLPTHVPLARQLVIDSREHIWVRRFRSPWQEQTVWDILSPEWVWKGRLMTPNGLAVFEIGEDYILGLSRDASDVERVQLFRLRRSV